MCLNKRSHTLSTVETTGDPEHQTLLGAVPCPTLNCGALFPGEIHLAINSHEGNDLGPRETIQSHHFQVTRVETVLWCHGVRADPKCHSWCIQDHVDREAEGEANGHWVPGTGGQTCLSEEAQKDSCPPELWEGILDVQANVQSSVTGAAGFYHTYVSADWMLSVKWG